MNLTTRIVLPVAASILLLTLITYLPAIRGGFIWDDDDYVTGSMNLRTVEGLGNLWFKIGSTKQYYPLVHTSFWVEYHLWELAPIGYHLVNVVLHALNAILLWILLRRLSVPGALWAALIFAVHPVHVESVAWITERKNVLSCFFYLASALAYIRFPMSELRPANLTRPKKRPLAPVSETRNQRYYVLALFLYLCALLSKTVTASLPAALLLVLWWKRGKIVWKDAIPLIPMAVFGVALGLTTAWLEKHNVGAVGSEWNLSWLDRILIAGRALCFYAGKLVIPIKLTFIYPRWEIDASAIWQFFFPSMVMIAVLSLWLARDRLGRGPLVCVLFFAGTLTPALGFFNIYPMQFSYVADHFQYHASIGLIALFAASNETLLTGLAIHKSRIAPLFKGIVIALLSIIAWQHARVFTDLETLYRDTIAKNPRCAMARQNLGSLLMSNGKTDEATDQYLQILSFEPRNAGALTSLGITRHRQGRIDEAIRWYAQALAVKPNDIDALNNLAWIRATHPDKHYRNGIEAVRLAERACAVAVEKSPPYFDTLAAAYAETGDFDNAIRSLETAISLARALNQADSIETFQGRLALYQSKQPFREAPSP